MALDPKRIYTAPERAAKSLRCPECNARLVFAWRRARQPGRSEDLFTLAKASCPNRCDYAIEDIARP
jgi:hypothetical protein